MSKKDKVKIILQGLFLLFLLAACLFMLFSGNMSGGPSPVAAKSLKQSSLVSSGFDYWPRSRVTQYNIISSTFREPTTRPRCELLSYSVQLIKVIS